MRRETWRTCCVPRSLPTREALDIVIQVAEAIHFLHGLGVYHRDIKAENIILSESGQPKVMDFGTARVYPRRGGLRIHGAEVGPCPPGRPPPRRSVLGSAHHTLSGTKLYEARLFALAQRRLARPPAPAPTATSSPRWPPSSTR